MISERLAREYCNPRRKLNKREQARLQSLADRWVRTQKFALLPGLRDDAMKRIMEEADSFGARLHLIDLIRDTSDFVAKSKDKRRDRK